MEVCVRKYLRKASSNILGGHLVNLRSLLNTVKMKHKSSKGSIIRIWQRIDERVHGVSTHGRVINAGCLDELIVKLSRQE